MKTCIGQIIEIIYQDKVGEIMQRQIEIVGISDGWIRATCLTIVRGQRFV